MYVLAGDVMSESSFFITFSAFFLFPLHLFMGACAPVALFLKGVKIDRKKNK